MALSKRIFPFRKLALLIPASGCARFRANEVEIEAVLQAASVDGVELDNLTERLAQEGLCQPSFLESQQLGVAIFTCWSNIRNPGIKLKQLKLGMNPHPKNIHGAAISIEARVGNMLIIRRHPYRA